MTLKERWGVLLIDLSYWWKDGLLPRVLGIGAVVIFFLNIVLGIWWSDEPSLASTSEIAYQSPYKVSSDVVGTTTTATVLFVADTLLHKPGGFLSNDVTPPSIFLDNMPNWEYGVLVQVRDMARAMRENFSRSQSQSTENILLASAEPRFNFDNNSWIFPRSEDEYRQGIKFLSEYLEALSNNQDPDAQFYARADNLAVWLATVESRLGSISQRLSASVGQRRINTDLAGETEATQSTDTQKELEVKTPWHKVDDEFYYARGTCWALIQLLRAIEVDFAGVLEKKNARVSLQQIVRELESTQQSLWSPVILNGSGFGVFANHSLVMASYISRANAGVIDLRELLTKG